MDSKQVFVQAIERLLVHRTLEEITVTDIVAESGLSRSNFYNHFTDKYDLVNWRHKAIHEQRMDEFIKGHVTYGELLRLSLEGMGAYKMVYANSLASDAYEALRSHILRLSVDGLHRILEASGVDVNDQEVKTLIQMHTVSSCDVIFRWLQGSVSLDVDVLASLIERALPGEFAKAIAERSGHGPKLL